MLQLGSLWLDAKQRASEHQKVQLLCACGCFSQGSLHLALCTSKKPAPHSLPLSYDLRFQSGSLQRGVGRLIALCCGDKSHVEDLNQGNSSRFKKCSATYVYFVLMGILHQ